MYNSFWFIVFQKRFINNLFWSKTAPVLVAWNQFPSPELYSVLVFTITQPKQWRKGHSLEKTNHCFIAVMDGNISSIGLRSCAAVSVLACSFAQKPTLNWKYLSSLLIEIIILHCFDRLSLVLRVWVCLLIQLLHGLAMCSISI